MQQDTQVKREQRRQRDIANHLHFFALFIFLSINRSVRFVCSNEHELGDMALARCRGPIRANTYANIRSIHDLELSEQIHIRRHRECQCILFLQKMASHTAISIPLLVVWRSVGSPDVRTHAETTAAPRVRLTSSRRVGARERRDPHARQGFNSAGYARGRRMLMLMIRKRSRELNLNLLPRTEGDTKVAPIATRNYAHCHDIAGRFYSRDIAREVSVPFSPSYLSFRKSSKRGTNMSKPANDKKAAPAEKVPSLIIVTEEDDEFEEFEEGNWGAQAEEKEAHIKQQWQDDWDVDDADDDFCNQLRKELQKSK